MGIKNALHKAARSGAVLLTAIGLMGVGLAVAPSADAAATTYDIGKVGSVKIADLLDVEQNNRSLNANDKAFVGETLGWKHFKAIVQLDAHIDNVGSLHEGDVVSIPLSATGRFGWKTTTIDPKIRNGVGDVLFDVSASDTAITLTRTAAPAVGALNYRLQPLVDGWYSYPASRGDSTTLTAGGSSYTFTSPIPTEHYKMGHDSAHVYANGHSTYDSNTIMMRLLGGGTHDAVAQGKTPSTSTDALVYHAHVQSDQSGHAITVRGASFEPAEFVAFDAKTAGFSYNADVTGGIDTAMKEGSTSTPGGWTRKTNADGSIDLYANLGALWGDKAVRWKDGAKSYDATTNAYLKNNGNLIDQLDAVFTIGFDSTTEQRSATYTSDVTWNGKTTGLESGTFSNTPITSGVAEGESAIEYVGNGATGGKYLNNTAKPGTATTTASASQFTRTGYTFTGWNTKANGTGTAYKAGAAITYPTEGTTLTLYAQWKAISHTVTFDANGGTAVASQTVEDKAKAAVDKAQADLHKRLATGSKNGQYKLTLDVKGTGSSNKTVTPSDVVLLVDETSSMRECADGSSKADSGTPCTTGTSKQDNLGSIVDKTVTAILATNQGKAAAQQSRISVIRFAGRISPKVAATAACPASAANAKAVSGFTTDKATALPSGWNQGYDLCQRGTDWATAFENVTQAGTPRDVNKQVVLITDGLASASADDYIQAGTDYNTAYQPADETVVQKKIKAYGLANRRAAVAAQTLAKAGWHLRVIGVNADASAAAAGNGFRRAGQYPYVNSNGDLGFYQKGSQPAGYLPQIEWLASTARAAGDAAAIGSDFKATDIDAIANAMTSTVIATATMRNTTITDPLSKWVDPVGLTDGKGTGITVTKDGKAMTSGYTATYDAKTRTIKVVLSGDLTDGSLYAASFEVVMSDAAKSDYMLNGTYPDTGAADTGLNAGKKGYFTNGDATLTWDAVTTVDGVPTTVPSKAAYPKPAAAWSGSAPSVLTNHLPGTGGTASLIPVIAGMGIAIAIAAAWVIRRRLA